jgi:anti-anti-sigma factor
MKAVVHVEQENSVISLHGRFDFTTRTEYGRAMDESLASQGTQIQVVMEGVEYLDSSALGMLLSLRQRASEVGREVVLTRCSVAADHTLRMANFNRLFQMI